MSDLSRRDFLKFARNGFLWLSAAFGIGGVLRFLDYEPNPAPKTEFDLGPIENYPAGSRTLLSEPQAVLLHTESGFSALSLVCTHLGCTVDQKTDGFAWGFRKRGKSGRISIRNIARLSTKSKSTTAC